MINLSKGSKLALPRIGNKLLSHSTYYSQRQDMLQPVFSTIRGEQKEVDDNGGQRQQAAILRHEYKKSKGVAYSSG
jgi:hypothetical protein